MSISNLYFGWKLDFHKTIFDASCFEDWEWIFASVGLLDLFGEQCGDM
jgi:hypothetical protein